jgi:hypothetical protein
VVPRQDITLQHFDGHWTLHFPTILLTLRIFLLRAFCAPCHHKNSFLSATQRRSFDDSMIS